GQADRRRRLRAGADRAGRAAAGRRQRQVLHPGAAPMTSPGPQPVPAPEPAGELEARWVAPNYAPLPVTLVDGEGAWVVDDQGRRYIDMLAAYSALNFGHRHPRLLAAAHAQLERITLTSRAFRNDQLGRFAHELAELCGKDRVLPMNTGAEAV